MTEPRQTRAGQGLTQAQWLLIAAIALIGLVLAAKLPGRPWILAVLNDAAHAPVFGALALVVFAALGLGRGASNDPARYVVAFALTVVLGGAVELVQGQIGRGSSWYDVYTDALGAGTALGLLAWWSARNPDDGATRWRRLWAAGTAIACFGLILAPIAEATHAYLRRAAQFPVVTGFDVAADLYFLRFQAVAAKRTTLPPRWQRPDDPTSLCLAVTGDSYPGLLHLEPAPDWRAYRALNVDVTNPAQEPLMLTVRVHDAAHDQRYEDRFNRGFTLAPAARQLLTIPLADIEAAPDGRLLDLAQVAGVGVFATDAGARPGRGFCLTRMWLD